MDENTRKSLRLVAIMLLAFVVIITIAGAVNYAVTAHEYIYAVTAGITFCVGAYYTVKAIRNRF